MKKTAIIAMTMLMSVGALPSGARAGDGGAVAAGVIGGLVFGAAIADSERPFYVYEDHGYVPVYQYRRVYRPYYYRPYGYYPSYGYRYNYGYGGYDSWYDY